MRILISGIPDLAKNYTAALRRLGAEAHVCLRPDSVSDYNGLLLPGGGDMDPAFFGENNCGSVNIDPALDQAQLSSLDAFLRLNKPVLGICRGMQLLNVYFGGSILQDLPTASVHAWNGNDQVHPVQCVSGSVLGRLYGPSCLVNSAHHQGIAEPGEGLIVIQHAPDGVAEAIVHTSLPILGIQWHPERMCFARKRPDTPDGSLLLARFLSLIRS